VPRNRPRLADKTIRFQKAFRVSHWRRFPVIAVISELWPHPDRQNDYDTLAAELRPLLESIDAFISAERFESCNEPGYLSFSPGATKLRWHTGAILKSIA